MQKVTKLEVDNK